MNALDAIQHLFLEFSTSPRADRSLERWRSAQSGMPRVDHFEHLILVLRTTWDPRRESVLSALCREAASGDDDAALTLIWALAPGLRRTRRELAATSALDRDDLEAEILAGLWSEIPKLNGTDSGVSARLLNRARWRALEASHRVLERNKRERLRDNWPVEQESLSDAADYTDDIDCTRVVDLAVAQGVITSEEAEIVMANRQRVRDLCEAAQISLKAFQSRRWRALNRIGTWFRRRQMATPSE